MSSYQNSDGSVTIVSTDHKVVVAEPSKTVNVNSPNPTLDITKPGETITVYSSTPVVVSDANKAGQNPYFNTSPPTTTITGIAALRGLVSVNLSWIELNQSDHFKHVEIWRSELDNIDNAVCVGDSRTQTYVDTASPEKVYYYWLRPVTYLGNTGEFYGSQEVLASSDSEQLKQFLNLSGISDSVTDLEQLMQELLGGLNISLGGLIASNHSEALAAISESFVQLSDNLVSASTTVSLSNSNSYSTIQEQITLLLEESSAFVGSVSALSASLSEETTTRESEIETVNLAYANLEGVLTSTKTALEASIALEKENLTSLITAESAARVADNLSLASTVSSLSSEISDEVANRIAAIDSERSTRVTNEAATATLIEGINSGFLTAEDNLNARINTTNLTFADEDAALASRIEEVYSEFVNEFFSTNANVTEVTEALSDAEGARAIEKLELEASIETLSEKADANVVSIQEVDARVDGFTVAVNSIEVGATLERELNQIDLEKIAHLAETGSISLEQAKDKYKIGVVDALAKTTSTALVSETEARVTEETRIEAKFDENVATINQTLTSTADDISAVVSDVSTLNTSVGNIQANYVTASYVSSTIDSAEVSILQQANTSFNNALAGYSTKSYAIAAADSAAAGNLTEINARFDQNTGVYGQQIKTAVDAADAATLKSTQLAAGIYEADNTTLAASFINSVEAATATVDGETIAQIITDYTVSAGGQTHTIQDIASASIRDDGTGFKAQWGVSTDLNGLQHGVGFFANGGTTEFVVTSNNFVIREPGTSNTAPAPFVFTGGTLYLDSAKILELETTKLTGTISSAQIAELTVDKLTGDVSDAEVIDIPSTSVTENGYWYKLYDFTVSADYGNVTVFIPRIDVDFVGNTPGNLIYQINDNDAGTGSQLGTYSDVGLGYRGVIVSPSKHFLPGFSKSVNKNQSARFVGWVKGESNYSQSAAAYIGTTGLTPFEVKVIQRGDMITVNFNASF